MRWFSDGSFLVPFQSLAQVDHTKCSRHFTSTVRTLNTGLVLDSKNEHLTFTANGVTPGPSSKISGLRSNWVGTFLRLPCLLAPRVTHLPFLHGREAIANAFLSRPSTSKFSCYGQPHYSCPCPPAKPPLLSYLDIACKKPTWQQRGVNGSDGIFFWNWGKRPR